MFSPTTVSRRRRSGRPAGIAVAGDVADETAASTIFDTTEQKAAVEALTPRMRRIRFSSPDLGDFVSLSPDDHVKLVFPIPGGEPVMRDYTPRAFDTASQTLVIDFALHQCIREFGRGFRRDRNINIRRLLAQYSQCPGQPDYFLSRQEPQSKTRLVRSLRVSCSFARDLYLHQCQPCMIEEYPSSRSELNASRFSLKQLHAQFQFEFADLFAQRAIVRFGCHAPSKLTNLYAS